MTTPLDCRTLCESLPDAARPGADRRLEAHLEVCPPCADLVARERRLADWLDRLPRAPTTAVEAPRLPASSGGRLLPWRLPAWTAAAAAAAILVGFAGKSVERQARLVRVERVVDVADAPPQDERLLALTAGIEAVAMRRPTEIR